MLASLLLTASKRAGETAILGDDRCVTYGDLLAASKRVAGRLRRFAGKPADDLAGARIGLLAEPSAAWVEALLGIWRAGGHAVPLALAHPEPELEHVLRDADAITVLVQPDLRERIVPLARRLGIPVVLLGETDTADAVGEDVLDPDRLALLLYTSGTTGRPKGVPLRHRHLEAQVRSLSSAWRWTAADRILGVLPLHHVHGIVNVVLSALWNGAQCRLHRRFDAGRVWRAIEDESPTLFMAVPTIYRRLIEAWDAEPDRQERRRQAARTQRLMVSGSAALPEPTLVRWRAITGHTLLERYGMTELGMALSQPYDAADGPRVPGTVGSPLPGVTARLVGDELQVRGPGVFDGYWRRPEDSAEAFTRDGFFRTGDVAERDQGTYRLLGRASVDILKSGGEKISALEVEAILRTHPAVADAAVVGVTDDHWGQRLVAFVEPQAGCQVDPEDLRRWCKERLASFKVPRGVEIVSELPRNALGKVVKSRLTTAPRPIPARGEGTHRDA